MDRQRLELVRSTAQIEAGTISYVEAGDGFAAVFIHGALMSSHLWRHALGALSDTRRCIAPDLPAHGSTRVRAAFDFSLHSQAQTLTEFVDTLALDQVDLVGNDTGGAVCQIFAAENPERLRTLTLTNCDVQDEIPPAGFKPVVEAAAAGLLAPALKQMYEDPAAGRVALGQGYRDPDFLSDDDVREYFGHYRELDGGHELERMLTAMTAADLRDVEPKLNTLKTPTLVAWGTSDTFFDVKWAYWLKDTIPGALPVIEIEDAKLFWPDEDSHELVRLLRAHWSNNSPMPLAVKLNPLDHAC